MAAVINVHVEHKSRMMTLIFSDAVKHYRHTNDMIKHYVAEK